MYKGHWRFRLPNGVTGSALLFTETEATGLQIDKIKVPLDGERLRLATELPGLPYVPGDDIKVQVSKALYLASPHIDVVAPNLKPGEHHPRIWRQKSAPGMAELYRREFASTIQAVSNLFIQGSDVYRYIEPTTANNDTHGHRLREVLILACTEVEAAWRAVLVANGKALPSDRLSTNQYITLLPVMRLDEWELGLANYPGYPPFKPFAGWTQSSPGPTQSLDWYNAYNQVKHDREANFRQAKLEYMIKALGACYVMLIAQFGHPTLYAHDAHYPDPFIITQEPNWDLKEQYVPPYPLPGQPLSWISVRF